MISRSSLLACLLVGSAQANPVSKLPSEWFIPSATSEKSFTLVDQASGTVRPGSMSSDGEVTWLGTIPTGIEQVSDVTGAILGSYSEIIALTSPTANRVGFVEVDAFVPFLKLLHHTAGIGPCGLAAVGTAPNQELWIASASNGPSPGAIEVHDQLATGGNRLAFSSFNQAFRRLQPLSEPGSKESLALYTETFGTETRLGLALRSGAAIDQEFRLSVPRTTEFATSVLSGYQPSKIFAVGYRSGSALAELLEFRAPLKILSDITRSTPSFPFPVSAVIPLPSTAIGPVGDGFIALAADGTEAQWLRINAANTGFEATSHGFKPASGQFLKGILPMPGIGLIVLQSPSLAGPATSYSAKIWNGSKWAESDRGDLPAIPSSVAAQPTLWFYDANPADSPNARLLGIQSLGQWTTRTMLPDDLPSSVHAETFTSPAGLALTLPYQPVSPPSGATYAITNQVDAAASLTSLNGYQGVTTPDAQVHPASGTFQQSFQITAQFDESRYILKFRQAPSGIWQSWEDPIPVAWSANYEFFLQPISGASPGPILTRNYTLPPASLANIDSDHDGVPDYVELARGLDPFAGADSDGDAASDLDELLLGTDPTNPASIPSMTKNLSPEGLSLFAVARNAIAQEIATGELLTVHTLSGAQLAQAAVDSYPNPTPSGAARGAQLISSSPPPANEILAISSPLYFNVTSGVRSGREVVRLVPPATQPSFAPAYTPSESLSLSANATAWIAAANTSASSHTLAAEKSTLDPVDAAVSVLLEDLVHRALSAARPAESPAPALNDFTLFAGRDADRARSPLTNEDVALLKSRGFDFQSALTLANSAKTTSFTSLATSIYSRHVSQSAATAGMPLPIDALREVLRTGTIPTGYSGAVMPVMLADARATYQNTLNQEAQNYRPWESWLVEIPASSPAEGVYLRQPGDVPVVLKRSNGTRFLLEQGLGLRPGTQFSIIGYSDVSPDGSYPAIEITSAFLTLAPASSDSDADGNLLDDQWEQFFFGSTGQDPFSKPNSGSHTLLQYFLDGVDPRSSATPQSDPVAIHPQAPAISRGHSPGMPFFIDFSFPDAYQDRFEFVLERSDSLAPNSFTPVMGTMISHLGGNTHRVSVPLTAAPAGSSFYRVRMRLIDVSN